VISTRYRIARNLAGMPFPHRASDAERRRVAELVSEAVERGQTELGVLVSASADELNRDDFDWLIDRRYVSADWLIARPGRWIGVATDGSASILTNEEDHIRLQAILPGLLVESVRQTCIRYAGILATTLQFSRNERIGFLTASLANAGSGVRVGVLMHLAALSAEGSLPRHLDAALATGCSVRGLYGEGSVGTGSFYQLSTGLGRADERMQQERISTTARYLIDAERRSRIEQFSNPDGRRYLTDAAQRAVETLFTQDVSPKILLQQVSVMRLAIAQGILPGPLTRTAEWVVMAGAGAAGPTDVETSRDRFEAVRRSALVRQQLRDII